MVKLTELAERCEQETGANKMLDEAIYEALAIVPSRQDSYAYPHYAYTASLDAAMTLVPEGLTRLLDEQSADWRVSLWSDQITPVAEGKAETAALALCAAALRARTQNTPDSQRGGV